jgi:hypothetical protein
MGCRGDKLLVGSLSDLLLFNRDIAKFCGIKDFAAALAFHELGILISGDDLDNWVFADGAHVWGE